MNHFELFSVPEQFMQDAAQLEKRYFELQRQFHPDRLVGKTQQERQNAIQTSMDINEAYQTLKSPLLRAEYLLHLHGIEVNTEHDTVKPDRTLLTEIMELREALQDAENVTRVADLQQQVQQVETQTVQTLAASFEKKDYTAAAQHTLRLGYYTKIRDEVRIRLSKVA